MRGVDEVKIYQVGQTKASLPQAGAEEGRCAECRAEVWRAPSHPRRGTLVCLPCLVRLLGAPA